MSLKWIALAVLGLTAAGPATAQQQTSQPVYAVMGQHALYGRSKPSAVDDRGLVVMQATDDSKLTCLIRYSYVNGGDAAVECSDGAKFDVPYQGMSPNSGSGRTTVGGMVVSICYGMTPRNAIRHLTAPAGFALTVDGDRVVLRPN